MPETNAAYSALQQQMGQLSKPLQGGANQKAPLMESLIESVPLMFAGIADTYSGDNTTSQLVGSIMARRERQQQLARENELDLRKFQLMVGLKGFEAELAKLENDRKGLESTANIEQSKASAEASRAAASKYTAEAETERKFGSRLQESRIASEEAQQRKAEFDLKTARDKAPIEQQTAETELEFKRGGVKEQAGEAAFWSRVRGIDPGLEAVKQHPTAEGMQVISNTLAIADEVGDSYAKPTMEIKQYIEELAANDIKSLNTQEQEQFKNLIFEKYLPVMGKTTPKIEAALDRLMPEVTKLVKQKPSEILKDRRERVASTKFLMGGLQSIISGDKTLDDLFAEQEEMTKAEKKKGAEARRKVGKREEKEIERAEKNGSFSIFDPK